MFAASVGVGMSDLDFTSGGLGLWNGTDTASLEWDSPTAPLNLVDQFFGYDFDVAEIGATFSLSAYFGIVAKLDMNVGTIAMNYDITLADPTASSADNPILNQSIIDSTSGWSIGDTSFAQAVAPDASLTTAELDLIGGISADIVDIGLTGVAVPDVTLDDVHLAGASFTVALASLTSSTFSLLPDFLNLTFDIPATLPSDGLIVGGIGAPTAPSVDGQAGDTLGNGFVALHGTSLADPFASIGLNVTKILGDLVGIKLEDTIPVGIGEISYSIVHVDISLSAAVKQVVDFAPTEVDVHVDSTLGQSFDGKLGDDFIFDTGEGYGSFDVTDTYTLHGTLTDALYLVLAINLNYSALEGSVHIDDIGTESIGPLIGPDTIPIWSTAVKVDSASYDVTLAPLTRTYTVFWEKFYTGTDDTQSLTLTPHQISIDAMGGNDTIHGNALDNIIAGGSGDDALFGDDGKDQLIAGAGTDVLNGENGDDKLTAGSGNDTLHGGADNDELIAGTGNALLLGEAGDDTVRIKLGVGNQDARGDDANTNFDGTNDLLVIDASGLNKGFTYTFEGPTLLQTIYPGATELGFERYEFIGTAKADTLTGGPGDDILHGAGGNDTLAGGLGTNILEGGDGKDTFHHTLGQGADLIYGGTMDGTDTSKDDTLYVDTGDQVGVLVQLDGAMGDGSTIAGVEKLVMVGSTGDDNIGGGSGNDNIAGGTGNDFISGGSGGTDQLSGDGGDDILSINGPGATVDGGAGFDSAIVNFGLAKAGLLYVHPDAGGSGIITDGGADPATSLVGIEQISFGGGKFNDAITGGSQNDVLNGAAGDDVLTGFTGDDQLIGGLGSDTLHGGDGNDSLNSVEYIIPGVKSHSMDTMFGEAGNDTLLGAQTVVLADGGAGDDTITILSLSLPANKGMPQLIGGGGSDTINGSVFAENIVAGTDGDATDGADTVHAGGGNDVVSGGNGSDSLSGGYGDDMLFGGIGDDAFIGGLSNPAFLLGGGLEYGFGKVALAGQDGNDTCDGGAGNDTYDVQFSTAAVSINLNGSARGAMIGTDKLISIENAFGGSGDDTLTGSDGDNQIIGFGGADTINGKGGNDGLFGGDGNDVIKGGDGNDFIAGGAGTDTMTGGTGSDTFVFEGVADSNNDLIKDLGADDHIDLSAIDADSTQDGDQAFTLVASFDSHAGEIRLVYDKATHQTQLQMDVNGDGSADAMILISGNHTTGIDFVL